MLGTQKTGPAMSGSRTRNSLHQVAGLGRSSSPPRGLKAFLYEASVVVLALRFERLVQSPERPWIAGILFQFLAEYLFRSRRVLIHQQYRTQRLPDGREPVGRLAVIQAILGSNR